MANTIIEGDMIMNIRNEIKAYIVRKGFTMSELVEKLANPGPHKVAKPCGARRSSGMSELSPQAEARDMELAMTNGWSPSVPNLSDKLRRGSLRYKEAVELADALGYDLIWQKRR